MPAPPSRASDDRPARSRQPLDPLVLWHQVIRARGLVAQQRHQTLNRPITNARGELLAALEAYVSSLATRGRPIPYALRDELRLQRATCSSDRYRR